MVKGTMRKPKIGLLPLYIKLYDDTLPHMRKQIDAFHDEIAEKLAGKGLEVLRTEVCRIEPEFEKAVAHFEKEDVDAIVTLHLAYSPSLESSEVLRRTKLPLIVLDTTPDYEFTPYTYADAMLYNHGIHGVQDMCNMLKRNGKAYEVFAGHTDHSDVLDRVAKSARAAMAAHAFRSARVGIIGEPFKGMGDFRIPFPELKDTLGMEVVEYDMKAAFDRLNAITEQELEAEYAADTEQYEVQVSKEKHASVSRIALAVRKWIEEEKLTAFTMNFLATGQGTGFPTIPFAEASKEMAKGIGYAGEGDVMTAGLVGALMAIYPDTSFTEMFCPDWSQNSVFLSHMGEYNVALSRGKARMFELPFDYTDAENPTKLIDTFRPGKAVFVCLAPAGNGKYTWILSDGEMLDIPRDNRQNYVVNGWFRPHAGIDAFLETYSNHGGIHHAALVYGGDVDTLAMIGTYMGWETAIIK